MTIRGLVCLAIAGLVLSFSSTAEAKELQRVARGRSLAPVTPFVIDVDLRELPKPIEWRPGDPIFDIPKRAYLPPGVVPPVIDEQPDPLLDAQLAVTGRRMAIDPQFSTPLVNETGIPFNGAGVPDTIGDVGANHIIESINGTRVQIWDKAMPTPNLVADFLMDSLGTGVCANGLGDPVINYDRNADRWVMMEFVSGGNNLCVYVSQTPDPVTGGWFAYSFLPSSFPDYPKLGVWPTDANGGDGSYIVTANAGVAVYAMERGQMLAGGAAEFQIFDLPSLPGFGFQTVTPADIDGAATPPAGAPGIVMRQRDTEVHGGPSASGDLLEMWDVDVDWVASSNSSVTAITSIDVADFSSELCGLTSFSCMQQPGTGVRLDPLREVIMNRLQYMHHDDESLETIVGNYVVDVSGTDQGGIRWFELRRTGGATSPWSLYQEGTYSIDSDTRWMGGSSMDQSKNIALAYNISSTTTFPGLRYTGRLSSDPLGVMTQPETTIADGGASSPTNRYGDYAAMGLDPTDDCTFWFVGEYNPASQWSTRWAAFQFASCGCLLAPGAPTVMVDDSGFNEIVLSWGDADLETVVEYRVLRTQTSGGGYEQVALLNDLSPGLANSGNYSFTDNAVSGGVDYFYVVEANDGAACQSPRANEVTGNSAGICFLEPQFAGLTDVGISVDATCGINVDWSPASAECGADVRYKLYRSTDPAFIPGPTNLVVGGLPGTTTLDQNGIVSNTEYHYVVRAVDLVTGAEDNNMVKDSVVAGGSGGQETLYIEDWEDPATFSDWTVTTGPGFHRCGEWELASDGNRAPDNGVGQYAIANSFDCATLLPATSASFDSPTIDTSSPTLAAVVLDFDIYYNHQDGDDASVSVWDGAQWVVLWSDSNSDFNDSLSFDVSAYALGNANFRVRFDYQEANADRWFSVDNIRVGVDVICDTAPQPNPAPSGVGATSPLTVGRGAGSSTLDLQWDAASCGSGEYNLLYGDIADVASYAVLGSECAIGSGSFSWSSVPAGTIYYLVVGGDGAGTESSWGTSSLGERNGLNASGECGASAKNVVAACD